MMLLSHLPYASLVLLLALARHSGCAEIREAAIVEMARRVFA